MEKKRIRIPWFVIAMVLALITMSTIQVIWLRTSVQMKEQIFDDNVQHSLSQVAEMLTKSSTGMLQIDLEALHGENSGEFIQNKSSIGSGLDAEEKKMLKRVEALKIDSVIPTILKEHAINIPAVIGIFDRYGQPVQLEESGDQYRNDLESTQHKISINTLSIHLHFPGKNRLLLRKLLGQFALTGLMLALIAWGFFTAVIGAARNKRIDRIRRDLMNNLTHELKTPISTIGLAAEALKDPDMQKDNESFNYYIGLINEENKRLGMLVENVLQASLAESGKMQLFKQSVNIHDLIREVLKNVAIQVRKHGGKTQLELEAENPLVFGDRVHLTNVVFNLIDNAIKYAKGELILTISSRQTTDGVELRFQDNGIGISKEHLGKVFDRLYRVPTGNVHDVKGFGLGLSYVKTVVDRHDGTIRIESQPGKGSTFILELPHKEKETTKQKKNE
ncbi:MAG: HAMP domain-containing sensor histidine kinase [Bacteroidetes bacterium]|nr:HAMP domain-containing sensor histidine kinase [Bacteroidota bacterium]